LGLRRLIILHSIKIIFAYVLTHSVHSFQKSFIAGARSLDEGDLHDNLTYFKVPQTGIDSIRSKLTFKIFDEYANILKGMYSTRFNGHPKNKGDHDQMDTTPDEPSPPLITSLQACQHTQIGRAFSQNCFIVTEQILKTQK
jgi:hypothetical protein